MQSPSSVSIVRDPTENGRHTAVRLPGGPRLTVRAGGLCLLIYENPLGTRTWKHESKQILKEYICRRLLSARAIFSGVSFSPLLVSSHLCWIFMPPFSSSSGRSPDSTERAHPSPNDSEWNPATTYIADAFAITLQDDWTSDTVYRLEGPIEDGLQHVLQVNANPEVGDISVVDYAARQIERQTEFLEQGHLIARSRTALDNGLPASRAVFSTVSDSNRQLYQEDWYLVQNEVGYRLSARFTEQSLPLVGPTVEQVCRSFTPHRPLSRRR